MKKSQKLKLVKRQSSIWMFLIWVVGGIFSIYTLEVLITFLFTGSRNAVYLTKDILIYFLLFMFVYILIKRDKTKRLNKWDSLNFFDIIWKNNIIIIWLIWIFSIWLLNLSHYNYQECLLKHKYEAIEAKTAYLSSSCMENNKQDFAEDLMCKSLRYRQYDRWEYLCIKPFWNLLFN